MLRTSLPLLITLLINSALLGQGTHFDNLAELAKEYASENIDSCYVIVDSLTAMAAVEENEFWKAKAAYYQALCRIKSENFNEAKRYIDKYIKYAKEQDLTEEIALCYYQYIYIHRGLGAATKEQESINEAQRLFLELDDKEMQGKTLVSKANFMRRNRNFTLASETLEDAMEIYTSISDSSGIAETYNERGLLNAFQGEMETALEFFEKVNEIYTQTNDLVGLSASLGNIGFANLRLNNIDRGEDYIMQAYEIRKKLKNPERLSMSLIQISEVNILKNDFPKALEYSQQALDMAKEHELKVNESQCYRQISYIHEKMGNHDQALKDYKTYANLTDKLINEKIAKDAQRVEAAFQTAEKEKQIIQLEAEDKINEARISRQRSLIGGSALILGLLSFSFLRLRSKNKQIASQNHVISKSLAEKEVLLKEIHHRVKNNLQVISSLLGLQSRSIIDDKAKEAILEGRTRVHSMSLIHQNLYQKDNLTGIEMNDYLSKLSRNLFNTYNVSEQENITLETDIETIKLDVETVIPIGLIVNELITNSLKYAFPQNQQGVITVGLKEKQNELILSVSDNGIGINKSLLEDTQDSFGHSLIRAFRKKLNAELIISNDQGTNVKMLIKEYKRIA